MPETKICLIFAISTCLLEKYLASKIIKTIFIGSEGWKDIPPNLNQLSAPFAVCPTTNNTNKRNKEIKNIVATMFVLFKNL